MTKKEVKQDTHLGRLGLSCLNDAGFCGPPYNLSDLLVCFYPSSNSIEVSFYDMETTIDSKNKYYNIIKEKLSKFA